MSLRSTGSGYGRVRRHEILCVVRFRRLLSAVTLLAVALGGLTACQTKVGQAVAVGGQTLSDSSLSGYVEPGASPYVDQQNAQVVPKLNALTNWVRNRLIEAAIAAHGGAVTTQELNNAKAVVVQAGLPKQIEQANRSHGYTSKFYDLLTEQYALLVRADRAACQDRERRPGVQRPAVRTGEPGLPQRDHLREGADRPEQAVRHLGAERAARLDRPDRGRARLRDLRQLLSAVSQLERAVEVMDRLRSPGGCAWDAEQTHESLARYLLEETYEVLEAIERGDRALLREELGDLLLQVLFHARLAEEEPDPYSIEDVAGDLVDKLVRRHPHVFAAESTDGARADAATLNETLGAAEDHREGPHVGGRRRAGGPAGAGAGRQAGRAGRPGRPRRPHAGRRTRSAGSCSSWSARRSPAVWTRRRRCAAPPVPTATRSSPRSHGDRTAPDSRVGTDGRCGGR